MTTDAIERLGILSAPTDPEGVAASSISAAPPTEVFGLETAALLRFADIARDSTLFPARFDKGLRLLPQFVSLVPLVEQLQADGGVSTDVIAPYREHIYEAVPVLALADKVAAKVGKVAVNALNRTVERQVISRSSELATKAREVIRTIEDDVEHVARFENPKEQFVNEMNLLSREVTAAIVAQRDMRVEGKTKDVHDGPGGIRGFFIKAIHKVKGFFSRLFGRPIDRQEITAYDAGAGIAKVVKAFKDSPKVMSEKFPVIARFAPRILPATNRFTTEHYVIAAPEILGFLYSGSSKEVASEELLDSILRNPHDLRFLTKYKKSMINIQRASRNLVPALIDVIPETGDKVSEAFNSIQRMLGVRRDIEPSFGAEHQPKEQSFAFKKTFTKVFNKLKARRQKKQDD